MPALIERPKMSLQMWAALKAHIMRERERKKQEQEADEAIERLRREQEQKRKQDQMTLEEIKDQVVQSEKKLKDLKDEKHKLFMQLKKVLHEDETRRRAHEMAAAQAAAAAASQAYATHPGINAGSVTQSQSLYIQNIGRTPVLYKMATPNNTVHSGSLKRPLTPSPPPMPHVSSSYQPQYTYKAQVTAFGPKLIPYPTSVAQQTPVYYTTHHIVSGTPASSAMTDAAIYSYGAHYGTAQSAESTRKHTAGGYGHITQGFTRAVPQQLEHGNPKGTAYTSEEKFYVQAGVMQRAPVGGSLTTGQPVVAVQRQLGGGFTTQQSLQRHQYPSQQEARFY